MVRFFISTGLHLLGNAIGLLVAAWVLDDMSMDALSLVWLVAMVAAVILPMIFLKQAVNKART